MAKRPLTRLAAVFLLFACALAACSGGNCPYACEVGIACGRFSAGTIDDCIDWCQGQDDPDCSEACNGIPDCTDWVACISQNCFVW